MSTITKKGQASKPINPPTAKAQSAPTNGKPKTVCPITHEEFAAKAKPIMVKIGDNPLVGGVKAPFDSGSFGFWAGGKIVLELDGVPYTCQVSCNIVAIGSKPIE